MLWKILIGLSVVAIIAGGVVWIKDGMQIYTKTREQVVTEVKDDLFGTVRKETTWVEKFQLGLVPDDASITVLHRSYGFILGVAGATILGSIIMLRKRNKRQLTTDN